jgi:hypothetical protein
LGSILKRFFAYIIKKTSTLKVEVFRNFYNTTLELFLPKPNRQYILNELLYNQDLAYYNGLPPYENSPKLYFTTTDGYEKEVKISYYIKKSYNSIK